MHKSQHILSLPPEILLMLIRRLSYRKDLISLSGTCSTFQTYVYPYLYANLVLRAPQLFDHLQHLDHLISSDGKGLQCVKSIRVTTQISLVLPDRIQRLVNGNNELYYPGLCFPHEHTTPGSYLNSLVRRVLRRLSPGRLEKFTWDHASCMDSATLRILLDSQAPALRVLKLEQYGGGPKILSPLPHIPRIDSLCVYSLEDRASRSMVEEVLSQHSGSIRHLSLGAENFAALFNHNPTDKAMALELLLHGVRRMVRQLVKRYEAVRSEGSRESPALKLESCALKGLEADSILQSLGSTLVDVTNLTSLCLEACSGLERALQFLSGIDGGPSMMKLQSFVLRHTTADSKFGESLLKFLQSVPSLAHLSVLLESPNQVDCLPAVLQVHGQTLKSLVWDEQPIGHNARNILIPPCSQLKDILEHCPGLVELGVCLNWEIFTGARDSFVEAQRLFEMPKSLRTLNIRNMPPGGIREHPLDAANSVLETIFNNTANVGESPPLETLALGALTYRDLRKGLAYTWSQNEESHLYQAFHLHVYRIKWQYLFDVRKPSATLHEIGSYEKTEAGGGSVNVLKPYWLNRDFFPAGG